MIRYTVTFEVELEYPLPPEAGFGPEALVRDALDKLEERLEVVAPESWGDSVRVKRLVSGLGI